MSSSSAYYVSNTTAANLTKSIRAQVDAQLDSWRVRAHGLGSSTTYAPRAATAASVNDHGAGDTASVDERIHAALKPVLEALADEVQRRRSAEDMVQNLASAVLDLRRDSARTTDVVNQLKGALSDTQISLRATQEELTSLRRRTAELERTAQVRGLHSNGDDASVDGGGVARSTVRLSTAELLAVMNTAMGNSADGMQRLATTANAVAPTNDALLVRTLREEMASLRDDMRAELNFALRRVSGHPTAEPHAASTRTHTRTAGRSVHSQQPINSDSIFVLRDESLHQIIQDQSAVVERSVAPPLASPARPTMSALSSPAKPQVGMQARMAAVVRSPPQRRTDDPFADSEEDDGMAPRDSRNESRAADASYASGGLHLSVYEAALARGRVDDVAALRAVEELLDDEADARARVLASEFHARDLLRTSAALSAAEAAATLRSRLAEEAVRNARVTTAVRHHTAATMARPASPPTPSAEDDSANASEGTRTPTPPRRHLEPPVTSTSAATAFGATPNKAATPPRVVPAAAAVAAAAALPVNESSAASAPPTPPPAAPPTPAVETPAKPVAAVTQGSMRPPSDNDTTDSDVGDIELPGNTDEVVETTAPIRQPISRRQQFGDEDDGSTTTSSVSHEPAAGFTEVQEERAPTPPSAAQRTQHTAAAAAASRDGHDSWSEDSSKGTERKPSATAGAARSRQLDDTSSSSSEDTPPPAARTAGPTRGASALRGGRGGSRLQFSSVVSGAFGAAQDVDHTASTEGFQLSDAPVAAATTTHRPMAQRGRAAGPKVSAALRKPATDVSSGDEW